MERILRRTLDAIARDRRSGAAELALRVVTALQAWLRRRPKPSEAELLEIARALLKAQPSMASLRRLANEVALAADSRDSAKYLPRSLGNYRRILEKGSERIARYFTRALGRPSKRLLFTYSYSSTVVRAMVRARSHIRIAYCSESRPGCEGRRTAFELAQAGIRVGFCTDAHLFSHPLLYGVVLGADQILYGGFANKIGTDVLVERIRRPRPWRRFVWVLADTTKFWPVPLNPLRDLDLLSELVLAHSKFSLERPRNLLEGAPEELWPRAPKGVRVCNPYFGLTKFFPGIRVLTEKGWMAPARVRRELRKIRISPRLKELVD